MRLAEDYNNTYRGIKKLFENSVKTTLQSVNIKDYELLEAKETLLNFEFVDINSEMYIPDEIMNSRVEDYLAEYLFSQVPQLATFCKTLLTMLYRFVKCIEEENVKQLISFSKNNSVSVHSVLVCLVDNINDFIEELEIAFEEGDKFKLVVDSKIKIYTFDYVIEEIVKHFPIQDLVRILISSVSDELEKNIDFLLDCGVSPFLANNYGRTAFSAALYQGREDLAKRFLRYCNKIHTLLDKAPRLLNTYFYKGKFSYNIAKHLCRKDDILRKLLFREDKSAILECYWDAIESTKLLGTFDEDLITEWEGI